MTSVSSSSPANKTQTVKTYTLQGAEYSQMKTPAFYPGLSNLGKHYLVRLYNTQTMQFDLDARQYTVANCMNPATLQAYISALTSSDTAKLEQALKRDAETTHSLYLTLKEYPQTQTTYGMSNKIAQGLQNQVFLKVTGPLGLNLGVKRSGLHVAFAAGTGLLPFVDLVAYIVRRSILQVSVDGAD